MIFNNIFKNKNYLILFLFFNIVITLNIFSMTQTQVWFSPKDNISGKLIEKIKNSKTRIYAAIFMFTDKKIAQALIDAKNNGLDVQVVTDKSCLEYEYGKVDDLKSAGIDIFVYKKNLKKNKYNEIMHNKYAIFDNSVWTGSFNWTVQADVKNYENVICLTDEFALKKYLKEFEELKLCCNKQLYNKSKNNKKLKENNNSNNKQNKDITESYLRAKINIYQKKLVDFLKDIRDLF
jgi:phosphatidylserine/phosphatidylglycerophosphate/cardiolipin synthase-like enzyme